MKRSWNKINLPCIYVNLSIERISKFDFLPILSKIKGKEILYKLYGNTEWQTIDYVLLNINKHNSFYHNHQREMIWELFLNNMFPKH